MSAEWPQSLLDGAVYPHPVDTLELVETHISWVVLTGDYAYKIKKPLDLGFLDFSSLEKRRYYCERELTLNRRFSSDLYLEVVSVTGSPERPEIGGGGAVFDYAVKMRQFDNHQLAENLARRGELTEVLVAKLARTLAGYHRELPPVPETVAQQAADTVYQSALQNFAQIRDYPLAGEMERQLARCEEWMRQTYRRCLPLMERRQREGFIKDCHGDCHLGNIVVIDGEVILFDCIEFNDAFREMDTIAEAAFLSMDLCARDLPEQARRFLNAYLEFCGDYDALPLFNLYRCYYALVRAKVTLMKNPAQGHTPVSAGEFGEVCSYIDLAARFTAGRPPALVLMHGLSGSGKSWLGERIAAQTGAIRIRSDVERKRLFSLAPDRSGNTVPELYSREVSRQTFARLLELAKSIVAAGFTCIVDATFLSISFRMPFFQWATREQIPVVILACTASEETVLRRLARRDQEGADPSDAGSEVYRQQKQNVDDFTIGERRYLIMVDTERTDCVQVALEGLGAGNAGSV